MKYLIKFFLLLFVLPTARADSPLVLTSIPPLTTLVRNIAGDKVKVEVMIPAGAKAETFEPTLAQLESSSKAQLFISVGHPQFPFETLWVSRMSSLNPRLKIVKASDSADHLSEDPHVWLSPQAYSRMAKRITTALIDLAPEQKLLFESNLQKVVADIDTLDAMLKTKLAPYKGRTFLVFHPAWGYLARDYGLVQLAIEEHGKEPGPAKLAELISMAKKQNIKIVFIEPQFPRQGPELIAKELNARIEEINDLAEDWRSNLEQVSSLLVESFR